MEDDVRLDGQVKGQDLQNPETVSQAESTAKAPKIVTDSSFYWKRQK